VTPGRPRLALEIPEALDGERVDRVVALLCELPRSEAAALVAAGKVRLGGVPVATRSRRVEPGQRLEVDAGSVSGDDGLAPDPDVDLPLVHVDEAVIVVDKPAGLVVHPGAGHRTGTLVQGLLARFPDRKSVV
jgi:23S rRNA pseudouridine1911/1915/1917 synthase